MAARLREWLGSGPGMTCAMMLVATALALVMAATSAINDRPELWRGPPDEPAHRGAARYYVDHWLPPRVGDPATLPSYSLDYGFSYINDPDLVYFLAGKFAALASPVVADPERAFRLFNVFLLALLALCCWARPAAWWVFVPLVISPQVWYIFSYFNGDAFPLFLSILIAWQVCDPASRFNRFLDDPRLLRALPGALVVGLLIGLLALSKKNYYAFLALVPALVALVRLGAASAMILGALAIGAAAWYLKWFALDRTHAAWIATGAGVLALAAALFAPASRRLRIGVLAKLAILAVIAAAVTVPRFWWDAKVHGSLEEKRFAIGRMQEQIAKPEYKPSVIYTRKPETYHGIELRDRGVALRDLFAPPWNWHQRTFTSATGWYGWLQFTAPVAYYLLIAGAYAALFAAYAFGALRSRDATAVSGLILATAFSALTLSVAIYTSWVHDFQAQGRYLFPIAAMLAAGLYLARNAIPSRAMQAATLACFALSVYSFVFIGLVQVPRSF